MSVAVAAHKQRLVVEQRDPARVDFEPGLERLLHGLRDGTLTLAAALAAHEQAIVPGVRPRAAEIPGA